ncbi:MAG: hypothetical protein GX892_10650 [Thermoanaerobacteraceae bacterium]|nr:hypothetical protein [Thermoanaerobacteraceae bacterium]
MIVINSITTPGIFTGQGLIAFVFFAFGLFLFYKARDKTNPSTRTDKKIYIGAVISLIMGIALLIVYIKQIEGVVA